MNATSEQKWTLAIVACVLLVAAYVALQFISGLLAFIIEHPVWVAIGITGAAVLAGGALAMGSRDKN